MKGFMKQDAVTHRLDRRPNLFVILETSLYIRRGKDTGVLGSDDRSGSNKGHEGIHRFVHRIPTHSRGDAKIHLKHTIDIRAEITVVAEYLENILSDALAFDVGS